VRVAIPSRARARRGKRSSGPRPRRASDEQRRARLVAEIGEAVGGPRRGSPGPCRRPRATRGVEHELAARPSDRAQGGARMGVRTEGARGRSVPFCASTLSAPSARTRRAAASTSGSRSVRGGASGAAIVSG
jgi:hypothetical protein